MTDLCALLAERRADEVHGIYVVDDLDAPRLLSYANLWRGALRRLGGLQAAGLRKGDPIVIRIDDPHEFLITLWSALLGGMVPVPVSAARHPEQERRLTGILQLLASPVLVSDAAHQAADAAAGRVIRLDDLGDDGVGAAAQVAASDLALIQFSSGSTGEPKGVRLSHANLLANARDIASRVRFTPEDRTLLWMPLTHDMGLIGSHFAPLTAGFDQYVMRPVTFLAHPERWLQAASRFGATILTTPNFGLEHFLRRGLRQLSETLDLSAIRLVVIGADPVSPAACKGFTAALAPHGLRAEALFPVYGLSEASVAVTFPDPGDGVRVRWLDRSALAAGDRVVARNERDPGAAGLVELGYPLEQCTLRIADDAGGAAPEGVVGEVLVAGANVACAYHARPDASAAAWRGGWLHTGDLGLVLDGRLLVTGRAKDVAFVAGQNVYLHDLDRIARHAARRDAGSCIVQRADGKESVVVAIRMPGDAEEAADTVARVRAALLAEAGVVDARCVAVTRLPKTTSGKLRRHALADQVRCAEGGAESLVEVVLAAIEERAPASGLARATPFLESGLPSIVLVELAEMLESRLGVEVRAADLFAHPTAERLAAHLAAALPRSVSHRPAATRATVTAPSTRTTEPIAIIGMAASVPGASDLESLWQGLLTGMDAVGPLPEARKADLHAYLDAVGRERDSLDCPSAGYLQRIDHFDPDFFGLSQAEATLLHPAHRLLLECAATALADAGLGERGALSGRRAGIYVGHIGDLEGTQYRQLIEALAPELLGLGITGNLGAFIAGRLANRLDTHGPAVVIDTACSASLAAIHTAANALRSGECELAIAGAARVTILPTRWPVSMGFESVSERCRSFDAGADGIAMGEGAGVVVLKPLSAARRDGDRVYATILGSALAHDGGAVRLSAPNPSSQAAAYLQAWRQAGIDPRSIAFIEAHGAGTRLSDPLEVAAMTKAFGESTADRGFCALGSVKSNLGHLFEAAGILGLIKAALSLWHGQLPATQHIERPNPALDLRRAPVFINTDNLALADGVVRAGVTSLGFSGTTCHVVLEGPSERRAVAHAPPSFERRRLWVQRTEHGSDDAAQPTRDVVAALLRRYSDIEVSEQAWRTGFAQLGLDSLVLIQLRQGVEATFGVKLPMRELVGRIACPEDLVQWLQHAERQPRAASAAPSRGLPRQPAAGEASLPVGPGGSGAGLSPPRVEGLTRRFAATRQWVDRYRPILANNRNVAGFTPATKELTWPVVAARASGSRVWDLDGNALLDFTMGFGVQLFGHDPAFVREAVREVLDSGGLVLGPIHPLAAQVAQKLVALAPIERVAFYNSGTEAVMVAVRCARTVTGRDGIAMFRGAYHGSHDQTLAIGGIDEEGIPFAPGVARSAVSDTMVLDYGQAQALEQIWTHRDRLACVLVEPVQSRRPDLQPQAFLKELRQLTDAAGIALIFDEVVTGFRLAPGGAQQRFGVRADLVTYGKILGGGLPIGAVGGSARFMAPIDGGPWRFGDNSAPDPRRTFVAGTFCQHPLSMAAADAVLSRIADEGPALQRRLEQQTSALVARLSALFTAHDAPLRAVSCASLFRIIARGEADVFFHELLARGVFIWEGRTSFLSTAHTQADIDELVHCADEVCRSLASHWRRAESGRRVPLTPAQRRTLAVAQGSARARAAQNQAVVVRLLGALDRGRLESAWRDLTARHQALRVDRVDARGARVAPRGAPISWLEDEGLEALRGALADAPDLEGEPLWRLCVAADQDAHLVCLRAHRLAGDGWSLGLVLDELARRYDDPQARLEPAVPLSQWPEVLAPEAPSGPVEIAGLRLATGKRPAALRAATLTTRVDAQLVARVRRSAAERGCSVFVLASAALARVITEWRGQDAITLAVPVAGQALSGRACFVGHAARLGAVTVTSGRDAVEQVAEQVATLYEGTFPDVAVGADTPADVVFNLDRAPRLTFDGLQAQRVGAPSAWTVYPLVVSAVLLDDAMALDWKIAADLIETDDVSHLSQRFVTTLAELSR